jgi:small subunit ribosomal protein S4
VYAEQLREKQKVKRMYGLREQQFRNLMEIALRSRGQTGLTLLKLLERRLDNVIYRLGLARTRPQARQFVNHGLILVDGQRVDIPSYLVKPGQEIEMKDSGARDPGCPGTGTDEHVPIPGWLEQRNGGGVVFREPNRDEIDPDIQEQRIVEFYSR